MLKRIKRKYKLHVNHIIWKIKKLERFKTNTWINFRWYEDSKTNNEDNNKFIDKNKKYELTSQETRQQTLEVTLKNRQKTLEKWI